MKFRCIHGYFIFEELRPGQISDFMGFFDAEIVAKDDFFTFATLADAPSYAIQGGAYLKAPVTKTFEGKPWEIFEANDLVYHFNSDLVLPIESIMANVEIQQTNTSFLASGLILPGSILSDGTRIKNYAGFYLFDQRKFKYTEITNG